MAVTQKWLKDNVGKPTTAWGSKYSAIYKLTGNFQRSTSTKKFKDGLELLRKLDAWSYSAHPGAKGPAAKQEKDRQQKWLNVFQRELKDYLYSEFKDETLKYQRSITDAALARDNKDRVRVILHEMMRRPSLVLKNTGKILQENVQDMTFDTNTRGGFVGSGGKAKLSINPVVLNNKTQGMGTLVHECHHKLNPMPGFMSSSTSLFKYIDEFVAHWKESVITRPGEGFDRSNWVNEKLKLYGSACSDWEKKFDPIKDIEQTGPYAVTDNSAKRTDSPRLEELAKLIKRT